MSILINTTYYYLYTYTLFTYTYKEKIKKIGVKKGKKRNYRE